MGSANKKAKQAGMAADELIRQQAEDTGQPAPGEDDKAQLKEVPKGEVEASADLEKNLDQPKSSGPGAEPAKTDVDWEARFKGLQTAYDRDVPKLRGELGTAYTSIESLQGQIDELKEAIGKPLDPVVDVPVESVEFTDEEIEQYGPGQIGMMKRIAEGSRTQMAKDMLELQNTIAELSSGQKRIEEDTVVSNEQKFFDDVTKAVPDWRAINTNPAFHAFLDEKVAYTDKTKSEFLTEARGKLQTSKVIQIFTDFLGVAPTSSSHSDEPELKPEFDVPEDLITPKNSGGGFIPNKEERYYTSEEVTQFYKDKAQGKYRGKEDEARVIENDIFAAGQQGRVITSKAAAKAARFSKDEL